ncbi:MAG TPA: hypothetical protein VMT58_05470 [Candidatus Binataceae bacterium]|nr:hypothetical protein [Candidatus Binataceae bacterium]
MVPVQDTDSGGLKLRDAGFDPGAPPAAKLEQLHQLRGEGSHDLEIARVLGEILDPGAATMLAEMEAGASGTLRREVRRALFRLKQHGIAPPAHESSHAAAVSMREPALTAMLSPIDATGARIVWIVRPRVQGGVIRMQALVSDDEGLAIAINSGMSRRELKAEREELERRANVKFIDADWRLADFILCEAWRNTPEPHRAKVGNFPMLRAELTDSPQPGADSVHPVYSELSAEADTEPSIELLKEPEFLEWRLPNAAIQPYADEIARAEESTIVVSPIQRTERVNAVIERAAAELLAGESGRKIRRRLEDIAYYMARAGRRAQAGWAAGAAKRLRDGADVKRIAFFDGFIRTQIGTIAATERQKREEEPHLIVTPAEAIAAQQARQRRR